MGSRSARWVRLARSYWIVAIFALPSLLSGTWAAAQGCLEAIGHCEAPETPYQLVVSGSYAYVIDTSPAVRVIDVSNPVDPVEVAEIDTWGWGTGVAISGEYLYVATLVRLRVADVSDPTAPLEVAAFDELQRGRLTVAGQLLFQTTGLGFRIYDISTPSAPEVIAEIESIEHAELVAVDADLAYVASGPEGVRVFDLSTPAEPVEIASFDTPGWALSVAVQEGFAYVADTYQGLRVVDVSSTTEPMEVASVPMSGATDVKVSAGLALVADLHQSGGLRVVDVSTPSSPEMVGHATSVPGATSVAVVGDLVYLGDEPTGLHIFDLADCRAPAPAPRRVRGRVLP